MTAHYINKDFQQRVVVLRVIPLNTSHTAANICNAVSSCFEEYNIDTQVMNTMVTDNAPNMVAAVRNMGIKRLSCFLHTLQLVLRESFFSQEDVKKISEKCTHIVGFFNRAGKAANTK